MKVQDATVGVFAWLTSVLAPSTVTLIVACAGGAYSSICLGEKIEPRPRMYQVFLTCIIMGLALTGLTNAIVGFVLPRFELTPGVQASIGTIVSFFTRPLLLSLSEKIKSGEWVQWIPFLRK